MRISPPKLVLLVMSQMSTKLRQSRRIQIYDSPFWLFFLNFIPVDRAEISHMNGLQNLSRLPSQPGYRAHMKRPSDKKYLTSLVLSACTVSYGSLFFHLRCPRASHLVCKSRGKLNTSGRSSRLLQRLTQLDVFKTIFQLARPAFFRLRCY